MNEVKVIKLPLMGRPQKTSSCSVGQLNRKAIYEEQIRKQEITRGNRTYKESEVEVMAMRVIKNKYTSEKQKNVAHLFLKEKSNSLANIVISIAKGLRQ